MTQARESNLSAQVRHIAGLAFFSTTNPEWREALNDAATEIEHLRSALATVVNYYDMLPGEGQEDTPTDWQYVARVMRTIANEVNAPEEMHGT